MYKKRNQCSKKYHAKRLQYYVEKVEPLKLVELPDLRRELIIIDHDFGRVEEHIKLYKCGRIDCYRAFTNGALWHERIGFSRVLEGIRKSYPRVLSPYSLDF
jgi:hypothetical protein